MDIKELEQVEKQDGVKFALQPGGKRIAVKGKAVAVERALERVKGCRHEVLALLREREGDAEVVRFLACDVPTLAIQKGDYRRWMLARPTYFHRTDDEIERMFSVCEEGDETLFDFAPSFTVRKADGRLFSVNNRGEISDPSAYSPAVLEQKVKAE